MGPLIRHGGPACGRDAEGRGGSEICRQILGLLGDDRRIEHRQGCGGAVQGSGRVVDHHMIGSCICELDILQAAGAVNLVREGNTVPEPLVCHGGGSRCSDIEDGCGAFGCRGIGGLEGDGQGVIHAHRGIRAGGDSLRVRDLDLVGARFCGLDVIEGEK